MGCPFSDNSIIHGAAVFCKRKSVAPRPSCIIPLQEFISPPRKGSVRKKTFGKKVKNLYFKNFFDENVLGEIH